VLCLVHPKVVFKTIALSSIGLFEEAAELILDSFPGFGDCFFESSDPLSGKGHQSEFDDFPHMRFNFSSVLRSETLASDPFLIWVSHGDLEVDEVSRVKIYVLFNP
jgi:hypothetical protein